MRILVTGASGTLGRSLVPVLAAGGHAVVCLDVQAGDAGPGEWVVGDVRSPGDVGRAMRDVELVVHTAAIHGIHLADHAPTDFLDLNVGGTFTVWEAAVAAGVRGMVFSSTMGVYGESRLPAGDDPVAWVHEDLPLRPTEVYGWTKVAGEELCRYHVRAHGIPTIALRYGMFVPEPFVREGIRYLYGGVHVDDVRDAVAASVEALAGGREGFLALNVESPLPFVPEDARDLRDDPLVAIERHHPGARELLARRGVTRLDPVTEVFAVDRLRAELGVEPRHTFAAWLDELRERPGEHADADPPWP